MGKLAYDLALTCVLAMFPAVHTILLEVLEQIAP